MISLGPPMYLEHRLQSQDSVTSLSQISNFTANDFINNFHFNKKSPAAQSRRLLSTLIDVQRPKPWRGQPQTINVASGGDIGSPPILPAPGNIGLCNVRGPNLA